MFIGGTRFPSQTLCCQGCVFILLYMFKFIQAKIGNSKSLFFRIIAYLLFPPDYPKASLCYERRSCTGGEATKVKVECQMGTGSVWPTCYIWITHSERSHPTSQDLKEGSSQAKTWQKQVLQGQWCWQETCFSEEHQHDDRFQDIEVVFQVNHNSQSVAFIIGYYRRGWILSTDSYSIIFFRLEALRARAALNSPCQSKVEVMDFSGVTGELKCGNSYCNKSLAALHLPVTRAIEEKLMNGATSSRLCEKPISGVLC